jgi:endonuclease/exonuclease/phosphatase family metal-dependent hydrolase
MCGAGEPGAAKETAAMIRRLAAALLALWPAAASAQPAPPAEGAVRVATFNVSLSRRAPGALVQEFRLGGSPQIDAVAEIIQRVRPDILLVNELDHDVKGEALRLFAETLETGRGGAAGIAYPHRFTAPSNTGLLSGFDLDGDGAIERPRDAFGFGFYEGQFGMAALSRFPIVDARTFQRFLWSAMPGALIPQGHYAPEAEAALRLSSKSHWDLTVETPGGPLHLLASHPTPPVFDGPEDANGRRNADEILFWARYLDGEDWPVDDSGRAGGAAPGPAVVLGDLNSDPFDGDGRREAIRALLAHPRLVDPAPESAGGRAAADPDHEGDPARDTAAFGRNPGPGAIRVDYVLPTRDLTVTASGVFWPAPGDTLRRLVGEGDDVVSSDHRLVWVDVRMD